MQKWKENLLVFCKNKIYVVMLSLTALFSYGFLVTHGTVGIDDTPYAYYFVEGLNVIVGRWLLYLLNKVIHIADFAPFLTDLAGVMIMMVAVTVWTVLLYSICKEKVSQWGYLFFACIFLSCPLLSEVYTYHLHNGVSIGYLCAGVSLCLFREYMENVGKKRLLAAIGVVVLLFAAVGCYESFMIVWLVGLILVLLTERQIGERCKLFFPLGSGAVMAMAAMVLRSLMIKLCTLAFGLEYMADEANQRSLGEMIGWLFQPDALAEFGMALKRVYVMYFAFAYAYYPIFMFVLAMFFVLFYGLLQAIRSRDVWVAVLTVVSLVACFLLVLIEGNATLYRAAQFVPLMCGYGALMLCMAVEGLKDKKSSALRKCLGYRWSRAASVFLLGVLLWNQCFDMNHWFYVDWLKYQHTVRTVDQIALELEKYYDITKPIVFTGTCQPPRSIIESAYVGYGTEPFFKINRLTGLIDDHLLEKFYRGENGVWVAQTPALSVLDWGVNAFESSQEMVKLFEMHGYSIVGNTDKARFEAATNVSMEWPEYPELGSIVDMGDHIIVHF